MALIECHECKKQISDAAVACPHCGAPRPAAPIAQEQPSRAQAPEPPKLTVPQRKRIGCGTLVVIGLLGLFGFGWLVSLSKTGSQTPGGNSSSNITSPDNASASAPAENTKGPALAMVAAESLKAASRNPDSLTIAIAKADPTGTYVCIVYRAQNGFGGMNKEHVAFTKYGGDRSAKAWNRGCAGRQLDDVTDQANLGLRMR